MNKELTPYLPYGINIQWIRPYDNTKQISTLTIGDYSYLIEGYNGKPILRPLSDITKEIEHNGEKFVPMKWFENNIHEDIRFYQSYKYNGSLEINIVTENYCQTIDLFNGYIIVQKLLEWHFDIFELIERGLAVDINTLKP
jgi:hypothetical protein